MRPTEPHGPAVASTAPPDHEHSDVNVRGILVFAAVLLVVAVVVHVAMWLLFEVFEARETRNDPAPRPLASQMRDLPPEPRLQGLQWPRRGWSTPTLDLRVFRRDEEDLLRHYDWVDERAGIVRIPIERAMDLIAERGVGAGVSGPPAAEKAPHD